MDINEVWNINDIRNLSKVLPEERVIRKRIRHVFSFGVGSRDKETPADTNRDLKKDPPRQLTGLTTTIAKAAPGGLG
ncbi:MAG: hypothetical protein KAG93_05040 [Desulfuromusa sp.]|nr:hypothetical protein [Desulfuromusa sp.]